MSSATTEIETQKPAESGFEIIPAGIEHVSEEKYMGEIFQRNLEENVEMEELVKKIEKQGLKRQAFPAICLKLGLEKLRETEDLYRAVFGQEIPDGLEPINHEEIAAEYEYESEWAQIPRDMLAESIEDLEEESKKELLENLLDRYEEEKEG